tara:strand:+ start:190 stop:576 length:387 start_codon:yes stop_codon:yes gene_type:complete
VTQPDQGLGFCLNHESRRDQSHAQVDRKQLQKELRHQQKPPDKTHDEPDQCLQKMKFDFSEEEFRELIAAAKEAQVRWKKARTLWKVGHHAYLKHNEQELTDNIDRFKQTEQMLLDRYKSVTGDDWHR